jgi:hypothetical protein
LPAQILAYVLMGVHFLILGYLLFGGILAWWWPRTLFAHVPLVVWGIVSSIYVLDCPITLAENWARREGGLPEYAQGFIETYIAGVLYEPHHVNRFRSVAALFVVLGWGGAAWLAARRRKAAARRLLPLHLVSTPQSVSVD